MAQRDCSALYFPPPGRKELKVLFLFSPMDINRKKSRNFKIAKKGLRARGGTEKMGHTTAQGSLPVEV